jgi:acyl-coenzyme A synthetase/AMP-(fatty) acid ligase
MALSQSLSTPQCILHWIGYKPNAVALIEADRAYSYGDLGVGVVQYVKTLQATGLQPGMLLGVACRNRYLHLLVLLAGEILGATTLSLAPAEIVARDPVLERCDMLCVQEPSVEETGLPPGGAILQLTQPTIDRIGRIAVQGSDLALLDHCPPADTVVTLIRTSGSTGRPKMMAMTQANTRHLLRRTASQPNDPGYAWNFLNLYGFSNRSSYQETAIALRAGCTVVSSSLGSIFTDMQRFAQFRTTLVSGDAVRLVHAIPTDWIGPKSGLIHIKGGAVPTPIRQRLEREVVTHVYHNYGANETSRMTNVDAQGVGTLLPDVTIRVMTDDGHEAPIGCPGQIEAKAAGMVESYFWDTAATEAAFRDGWYRTGDIGFMPAPGKLVVMGRADDWVNIGGIKFSPHDIEQRMQAIEGVEDAVLLSLPDAAGHDRLHVVLQSQDRAMADRCRDRLVSILSGHVALFVPHVLTALPRTGSGKVRRGELRGLLAEPQPGVPV